MNYSTGCVSIGTAMSSRVTIDRIVEFLDPRPGICTIWVDVYIANPDLEDLPLRILHRGNLHATNVTMASWADSREPDTFEATLSERIHQLHEERYRSFQSYGKNLVIDVDPHDPSTARIIAKDNKVLVGPHQYALWSGTPSRVVGNDTQTDI